MSLTKGYQIPVPKNSKYRVHLQEGRIDGVFHTVPTHWDSFKHYSLGPEDFVDTPTFLEFRAMACEHQAVLLRQRAASIRKFTAKKEAEEQEFLSKCRNQLRMLNGCQEV